MNKPNITSSEVARCLDILKSENRFVTAAELARRLFLSGNRETRRRHVRAIIKQLRDNGSMIVATTQEGYFLTEDTQLWQDYQDKRQIDAKRIIGEASRRKKMATYSGGQGALFEPVVTCGIG